jgi:hypothetical protein
MKCSQIAGSASAREHSRRHWRVDDTANAKISRTEGTSLNVKIAYPTGNLGANQASSQSNIKSVKVELPKQQRANHPLMAAPRVAIT